MSSGGKAKKAKRRHSEQRSSHHNPRDARHGHYIPAVNATDGTVSRGKKKKKSEFLHPPVIYRCDFPDPPFFPKLLKIQLPENRLVNYCSTTLERNTPYEVLTEADLGVPIHVFDREENEVPRRAQIPPLDPKDVKLFDSEYKSKSKSTVHQHDLAKQALDAQEFSSEFTFVTKRKFNANTGSQSFTSKHHETQKVRRKHEINQQRLKSGDEIGREVKAIRRSFEMAQKAPVHPTKQADSSLRPLEIYDVLPFEVDKDGIDIIETLVEFGLGSEEERHLPELSLMEGSILRSFPKSRHHSLYIRKEHLSKMPVDEAQFEWNVDYSSEPALNVEETEFHLVTCLHSDGSMKVKQAPNYGKVYYTKHAERLKLSLRVFRPPQYRKTKDGRRRTYAGDPTVQWYETREGQNQGFLLKHPTIKGLPQMMTLKYIKDQEIGQDSPAKEEVADKDATATTSTNLESTSQGDEEAAMGRHIDTTAEEAVEDALLD